MPIIYAELDKLARRNMRRTKTAARPFVRRQEYFFAGVEVANEQIVAAAAAQARDDGVLRSRLKSVIPPTPFRSAICVDSLVVTSYA